MFADIAQPLTLIAVLALATRYDVLEHRIPNALCGTGLVAAFVLQATVYGWAGLTDAALGCAVGGAVLLPFYLGKGMGAGDVKLMAAAGAFIGPKDAALAGALTLVVGAVLALALLAHHRLTSASSRVDELVSTQPASKGFVALRKQRFPYAAAIAGGTLILIWHHGQLAALARVLPT